MFAIVLEPYVTAEQLFWEHKIFEYVPFDMRPLILGTSSVLFDFRRKSFYASSLQCLDLCFVSLMV